MTSIIQSTVSCGLGLTSSAYASCEIRTSDILFGSDWPYGVLPAAGGNPAPALDALGPDVRAAVDATNVAALVPRFAAAGA